MLYKHFVQISMPFMFQCYPVSVSAISYVNNMGGMESISMNQLAKEIWQWCIKRDIFVSASFIPGTLNIHADYSSRNFSDSTEWMLKRKIFLRLCKQCFHPDVDLFASRLNCQVESFVSWFPHPGTWRYDAFSFCWSDIFLLHLI